MKWHIRFERFLDAYQHRLDRQQQVWVLEDVLRIDDEDSHNVESTWQQPGFDEGMVCNRTAVDVLNILYYRFRFVLDFVQMNDILFAGVRWLKENESRG